jgi:hypothetical protein
VAFVVDQHPVGAVRPGGAMSPPWHPPPTVCRVWAASGTRFYVDLRGILHMDFVEQIWSTTTVPN